MVILSCVVLDLVMCFYVRTIMRIRLSTCLVSSLSVILDLVHILYVSFLHFIKLATNMWHYFFW